MTERTKVALFLTTQHTVYEKAAEGEQDGLVNVFKAFCSTKPYIGHKIILEDVPIDPTTKRIPLFPVLLGCLRIIVQSSLDVDHPLALRLGQGVNCWYGNQLMPKYIAGQKALGSKSEGILPLILADEDHPVTEDVRNGAQQIFVAGGNEALIDTHPCG